MPSKLSITEMRMMVEGFQKAMGQEKSPPHLYTKFIKEEKEELLKEFVDVVWVIIGKQNLTPGHSTGVLFDSFDYIDAAIDLFGEEAFNEAWQRVYESNMSKLGDDGKPVYREDGKVMKGPNYKPPYLGDLV